MNVATTDPPHAPRIGSLFSGYGGLDQGVQAVLGGTTAWVSDIDPGACRILAHRYPDVPNLGDITAVNWANVEPVDVLTGGFPCQDVSHAGSRRGLGPGTRSGLWSRMADAIDHLRPSLVIAENVRGLLSAEAASDVEPCAWCLGDGAGEPPLRALGAVLADLAELGYDASWYGLRAADVGAPHGRFRVFVLAWPTGGVPADAARGGMPAEREGHLRAALADAGSIGRFRGARLLGGGGAAAERVEAGHHVGDEGGARALGGLAAVPDADGAASDQWRITAPGQAESGRARPDAGRRGGAPAPADTNGGPDERRGAGRAVGRPTGASEGHRGERERDGGAVDDCGAETRQPAAARGVASAAWGTSQSDDLAEAAGRAAEPREPASPTAWGDYGPAIRRWERRLGRPAPAPTEPGSKGQPRLSPLFVEWMMGLPAGWVTDVPGLSRNDQLKALGNGVVPQQAAAAVRFMLARLAEERRWAA